MADENRFKIFLALLSTTVFTGGAADNDVLESSNGKLYEEMKCVALVKDKNGRILSYNCDHLKEREKNKCYYNGKIYSTGESLSYEDNNKESCLAACSCEYRPSEEPAKFSCAHVECPSVHLPALPSPCYFKYELDQCCGIEHCPESGEKVHTCKFRDKLYKEGEMIYYEGKKCVCSKNFDGTLNGKECRHISCKYELLNSVYLQKFDCAPIYYNSNNGCPIEWMCYNQTGSPDSIDGQQQETGLPTPKCGQKLMCTFGPLMLRIGQKLKKSEDYQCVECSCNVPPYLTCRKNQQC